LEGGKEDEAMLSPLKSESILPKVVERPATFQLIKNIGWLLSYYFQVSLLLLSSVSRGLVLSSIFGTFGFRFELYLIFSDVARQFFNRVEKCDDK
jgi:hypothetical protein